MELSTRQAPCHNLLGHPMASSNLHPSCCTCLHKMGILHQAFALQGVVSPTVAHLGTLRTLFGRDGLKPWLTKRQNGTRYQSRSTTSHCMVSSALTVSPMVAWSEAQLMPSPAHPPVRNAPKVAMPVRRRSGTKTNRTEPEQGGASHDRTGHVLASPKQGRASHD